MNHDDLITTITQAVDVAVKNRVNGKIDVLDHKLDTHIAEHKIDREELRKLMQTRANFTFLYKSILSFGSLAAAWMAFKGLFQGQ